MKFFNIVTGQYIEPTDWQLQLKVGDYYINEQATAGMLTSETLTIYNDMPNVYGQIVEADEPGYFLVRAYSQWCPEGELGMFNICDATRKLTPQEFEQARANDWP